MNFIEESEIIGQKLKFIFDVEQNTNHVFPLENFTYYVFIKNISGIEITNFKIKILNEDNIDIEKDILEESLITLQPDETKLYTLKARCFDEGEYTIHFIGQGDNTELLYKTLKIKCSFDTNQEELIHKIHIYDFTPYENNYTLEAENYSQEVAQIFKRQLLPYKAGCQPFPMNPQMKLDNNQELYKDWYEENIESQSFIDQYKEAKNTKEYHYQYISRENFTEEAIESFTGKTLQDLADNINKNSIYFQAKFLRSGSNELLNDFNQYAPNGFIYRMGLLSSELYHTLGVIPEYTYMNDYLFRWAPRSHQQPNLYPKKKGMKWEENLWTGKGWNVYRYVTDEFILTDEYKKGIESGEIENAEFLDTFESKRGAEEFVNKLLYVDNIIKANNRLDYTKYKYEIEESYFDTGVFFVNIPLSKIPSNFLVPTTEELYSIINKTKPFGSKALIKYSIDEIFNHNLEFDLKLKYYTNDNFNIDCFDEWFFDIQSKKITIGEKECNGETINTVNEKVVWKTSDHPGISSFDEPQEFNVDIGYKTKEDFSITPINEKENTENEMTQTNVIGYYLTPDNDLLYLEDILESLYQKNNTNMSFFINTDLSEKESSKTSYNIVEVPIKNEKASIKIEDDYGTIHELECHKSEEYKLYHITNSIIINNKKYENSNGFENISSLLMYQNDILNKKIIIWFIKDTNGKIHYFGHEIINSISPNPEFNPDFPKYYLSEKNLISFETPFFYKQEKITPIIDMEKTNWKNLYRINNHSKSYAYINNPTNESITPEDIYYLFNDINISETAIIKSACLNINSATKNKNIYLYDAINTNYLDKNAKNHYLVLEPTIIEIYPYNSESSSFYLNKREEYINDNNQTLINIYTKLLEESSRFNTEMNISTDTFLKQPNDFINIDNPFWYEISGFTDEVYKLNETQSIHLIIEGYNNGKEVDITTQTLSGINFANQTTTEEIPRGYFRKKIDLYYPNSFLTNLLKVRFRLNTSHSIKIFDTRIEIEFKQAQEKEIKWDYVRTIKDDGINNSILLEQINNTDCLNNGLGIKLVFDDITQGEFYHISSINLYILYKETEMEMLINKNKYNYVPNNTRINTVTGKYFTKPNVYPSIEFFNDITTMTQPLSNIGPNNQGIKLKDSLYQSFVTRDDNITNIEIFPNGVIGNPDENIKIGLYENHGNTPGRLIKEVYANGWLKNNEDLKDLYSIKYNINIDNLKVNTTYWFKIEVINPKENSYYLLKNINTTQNDFKLLINENNNYINTLSTLQFSIYSKNLSRTFASIPCTQEIFDNPYIKIGLHKGVGIISDLRVSKALESYSFLGENHMSEEFEDREEVMLKVRVRRLNQTGEQTHYNELED